MEMSENINNKAIADEKQTGSVISYECPHCGAPLSFGETNMTECEHCGTEVRRIPPPIKFTEPIGQADDEDRKRGEASYSGGGMGFYPMFVPMFIPITVAHATHTSMYSGMGAAHVAHVHAVGGFAG
jgi:hypothetical protein